MSVMILDTGNSIIKAKIAWRENGEVAFPHTMKQLTESEYVRITNRAGLQNKSADYLRINGKPYVIGESIERHGLITQRTGTARYTRDYYGVLVTSSLARLHDRNREISVFGGHPPGDVWFQQNLMEALQRKLLYQFGDDFINIPH